MPSLDDLYDSAALAAESEGQSVKRYCHQKIQVVRVQGLNQRKDRSFAVTVWSGYKRNGIFVVNPEFQIVRVQSEQSLYHEVKSFQTF